MMTRALITTLLVVLMQIDDALVTNGVYTPAGAMVRRTEYESIETCARVAIDEAGRTVTEPIVALGIHWMLVQTKQTADGVMKVRTYLCSPMVTR